MLSEPIVGRGDPMLIVAGAVSDASALGVVRDGCAWPVGDRRGDGALIVAGAVSDASALGAARGGGAWPTGATVVASAPLIPQSRTWWTQWILKQQRRESLTRLFLFIDIHPSGGGHDLIGCHGA